MAPIFGEPNYNFIDSDEDYGDKAENEKADVALMHMAFWYMMVLVIMLLSWLLIFFCLRIITRGQKTRSQQQGRVYVGSRPRPSLNEPTVYVSPANLPPPPKYEALAPPSYEEVMSVTYPAYPGTQQPIVFPITHAVAQASNNTTRTEDTPSQSTVITVTSDDRRTSVTVAAT